MSLVKRFGLLLLSFVFFLSGCATGSKRTLSCQQQCALEGMYCGGVRVATGSDRTSVVKGDDQEQATATAERREVLCRPPRSPEEQEQVRIFQAQAQTIEEENAKISETIQRNTMIGLAAGIVVGIVLLFTVGTDNTEF